MKSKSIIKVLAVALVIAAAMPAIARSQDQRTQQSAPNPASVMGMMGPGMMSMTDAGVAQRMMGMMGLGMMGSSSATAMCTTMAGHTEGRLAYLKAELKITEAQESQWNAYAAAARDNANNMLARCMTMMSQHTGSTLSLPDRLDQNEQLMAAHLDAVRAMNTALKPLYAALNENQRQAADQLFWGPMGMM